MKILMISDLHYATKPFHGIDESKAFQYLGSIIENEKPKLVISAGDMGEEVTEEMLDDITMKTHFLTVYGNHDNIKLMKSLINIDGTSCWLFTLIKYNGIKIAGINGTTNENPRRPWQRTIENVKQTIKIYEKKGCIDIFVTHVPPRLPQVTKIGGLDIYTEAINKLNPKIYLCGHTRSTKTAMMGETTIIKLDSSAIGKTYATVEVNNRIIEKPIIKTYTHF